MASLKTLLRARLVCIFFSFALTVAATGLAGWALQVLHDDKVFMAKTVPGGKVDAQDVVVVSALLCAACGFAVAVATYAEIHLWRERRNGHSPWILRLLNEIALGVAALFVLGVAIAATVIVVGRSAVLSAPGFTQSTLNTLAAALGKNITYRGTTAYESMICAWFAFAFLTATWVLLVLAGLHYRKESRERAAQGVAAHETHAEKTSQSSDHEVAQQV